MLAYIFWHWPQANVDPSVYRSHLSAFHEVLARNSPQGFHRSTVFQIPKVPWLKATGAAFEDWYLVENSSALDPLEAAAVSEACEESHNRVAREAADGTAGLYRLRMGKPDLANVRFASWFSKPTGVSYHDFYELIRPAVEESGAGLWGRQMTLGPATEFCLLSRMPITFPNGIIAHQLTLQLVWPQG